MNLKFQVPAPTTFRKHKTAKEALENPPISKDAPNNEITSQSQVVIERLKFIRPGQNAWTADIPDNLRLNVRGAKLSQIYRRLDPDKPSYTLTGSGGGGTHGYHWEEPRALTNRERARIQTFPDNFIFEGSKESARKQIGMAVPPRLSEIIFTAVLKTIAGIEYENISPHYGGQLLFFENF
ncbi:DNA-cytosine methyltransferase [Candidatus Omnitrophus magneticus]|uniref:DNA (cytosine-5-)-methyltransferase n=1 Tax=Candidatus Omnitrophus magneticus TaxID=1609969 RepID=A0A0F0CVH8_9BACT|nr:DNA-cytosine methyltransferase [Candidatus Omnitrophus magneticus]